ncbi:MAG TPA: Rieske 2Fe-2S domain-containing protein, partial [bacterium]|nr:Rieske 2Fe-2S domain-containing protein [bacterium]
MSSSRRWLCTVCGYVHEGDGPPECCPACGALPDQFTAQDEPAACTAAAETWHDVGAAAELAQREVQPVSAGCATLALVHRNGVFTALSGSCNHAGGPLGDGHLDGSYLVCPWHNWRFDCQCGTGEGPAAGDSIATHAVKVDNGRVLVNTAELTPRTRVPREPHPLTRTAGRGEPGGPAADAPLRVVGISTTNMDVRNPRYSTSDKLLNAALTRAAAQGATTRLIRLAELDFRACEGYYSKSSRACTWPCSITQMDPADGMTPVYEAFVQ